MDDIDNILDIPITFSGEKGDKGDKGEQGLPGVDGVSIKGDKGETGLPGRDGKDGVSIKGEKGDKGDKGEKGESIQGVAGRNGKDGIDGKDGLSAYEIWLVDNEGTEEEFIASLKGEAAKNPWVGNAYTELKEQEDVRIASPLDNQVLTYDSTTQKWVNENSRGFITVEVEFTAQTSITVTHNNGYRPPVWVEDASRNRIVPLEVTQTTVNQFTVTFSSATTGTILYGSSGLADSAPAFPNVITKNEDYTILATDGTIKYTENQDVTYTLPTAVGVSGKVYNIKNMGTGTITLEFSSDELIDDVTTIVVSPGVAGAYPNRQIQSDNVGWMIL